ncbi:MAG: hypothetical protein ACK4SR_13355 [Thiobacillus sp.]
MLENVFGLPTSRATRDIDFAFAVESWEQFQTLKQRLASEASFTQMERAAQRLIFKPEGMPHSFVVDLIPFGGLETDLPSVFRLPTGGFHATCFSIG